MLKYILNKQARLIQSLTLDFTRDTYINKLATKNRLIGLIGQRGVGKTTILLQYLKQNFNNTEFLYFSADDIYIIDSSIYDIADEFVKLGGKVIVIDEIHKYNNWAQELKNIYDSFPNLLIRFSGSSMLNILNEKYDLSRRCVISHVKILSFREFIKLYKNIELPLINIEEILKNHNTLSTNLALENPTLYKNFKKYLEIGSYPFFIEDEDEYKNKLFNALDKVIQEDIPSINKINFNHISIFKKFIAKLIYAGVPYKVNISALSKELGISHPTLNTYINILEQTKMITPIRKFSINTSKKPEKLLFGNTNILYSFADEFGIEANIGTLRETFFVNCFTQNNDLNHIYYSDIGDFLLINKQDKYIFEIGGKNKSFKQIKDIKNSYLITDTDYTTEPNKIPLWLFGLMW